MSFFYGRKTLKANADKSKATWSNRKTWHDSLRQFGFCAL